MNAAWDSAAIAAEIDREHAMLNELLAALREAARCPVDGHQCLSCPPEKYRECLKHYEARCEDALCLTQDHFTREEWVMRRLEDVFPALRENFEPHREDHGKLMEILAGIICANHTPADGHSGLLGVLEAWLDNHLHTHDAKLLGLLRGEPLPP